MQQTASLGLQRNKRLQRPLFRNINQRVLVRFRLPALSERETGSYIAHHLARAGGRPEVFSQAAALAAFKASGGICRVVNSIRLAALRLGARQLVRSRSSRPLCPRLFSGERSTCWG